jgi:hypothetical protein
MRIPISGLLLVGAISWLPMMQDPGQRPPRPGAERGEQDPAGRPPRPEDFGPDDGPPPPPPPPNLLFLALDLDKDGEISSKELAKAATSLAKLDKNKDGVITEEEVRPPRPPGGRRGPGGPPGGGPDGEFDGPPGGGPPGGGRPGAAQGANAKALVDSVMKFDKDGDGKISSKELPERMARMMTEGDTNKDGYLERSEVETLSKKQGTQGNRRPGPPGGGPPGGGPPGGGPPGGPEDVEDEDHGRPVEQVAKELGVTPAKFREVFRKVRPAAPGTQPTEAQRRQNRKVLSEGLGVSPERLDEVMDKYRPGGPTGN